MGRLDEIRAQRDAWRGFADPIVNAVEALTIVNNSGFDTKIRQEASGFQNIWSGFSLIGSSGVENINRSGFIGVWTRLDTKISQEGSGFRNTWSGLNDVEREIIEIQVINRSGFRDIETDLERLVGINHSGFDTKIRQEASGFGNLWSGARLLRTINRSGFNDIEADLERLVGINHSGFDTKIRQEASGFGNTWSGLREIETTANSIQSGVAMLRQGETLTLSTQQNIKNISGMVSGTLGCYNRWTLYLQASGATNITLELTPDIQSPYFWFEPSESPIALASGTILEMGYDATYARIYADSGVGVTCRIRGCW